MTNSEDMEVACVIAGKNSGDLVHPLPYSPELHFSEFASVMADMKNSVAVSSPFLFFYDGLVYFRNTIY